MILDIFLIKNDTVYTHITKKDTSPNIHPNIVDETTNSHVNIDNKEI